MCVSSLDEYSLRVKSARWLSVVMVCAVITTTTVTVALAPAVLAAPGDASAVGFDANFFGTLASDPPAPISLIEQRGATAAPPGGNTDLVADETAIDLPLGPPINQTVRVAVAATINSTATSSAGGASAKASATDIQISTPAGLLEIAEVSSSVSCLYNQQPDGTVNGSPPTEPITVPAVTLNGEDVPFTDGVATIELDNQIGTATIKLTAAPPTIDGNRVTATGLLYTLDENLTDLVTASGTLAIARSS
jgi:hypothetical protein